MITSAELQEYLEQLQLTFGVSQILSEFVPLLEFIQEKNLSNFIEIGSSSGFSMLGFIKVINGKHISVDLPNGLFGGQSMESILARNSYWHTYAPEIISILGDSGDPKVVQAVGQTLQGEKAGVLFIDGDHRYEAVRRDYELYKQFVDVGSLIIFHDINPHPAPTESWQYEVGVNKFWNELQGNKVEFNAHENWAGIGVLVV